MTTEVRVAMSENPVTITSDASLLDATRLLKEKGFKHLPVVDGGGKLVGVVTDRDLKRASASDATTLEMHELLYLLDKVRIEQVMTRKPATIPPGQSVQDAARLMVERKIGCVPVVDKDKLVGIVTRDDLLMVLAKTSV